MTWKLATSVLLFVAAGIAFIGFRNSAMSQLHSGAFVEVPAWMAKTVGWLSAAGGAMLAWFLVDLLSTRRRDE